MSAAAPSLTGDAAAATPAALQIRQFVPAGCGFPPAAVPVMPWLRRADLRWRAAPRPAPGLAGASVRSHAFGRHALHAALAAAGVGPGTRVLAPAYHCRTMIDGALALGATVHFYRLADDLRLDAADLLARLDAGGPPVRAVIAAHFFGFAQSLAPLLAARPDVAPLLVEDCSHVLVGGPPAPGAADLGGHGRFGIASPYKFHPLPEGGLLWDNSGRPLPALPDRAGPLAELRATWHTLQRMRAPALPAPQPVDDSRPLPDDADRLLADGRPSSQFDARQLGRPALGFARWLSRHVDARRLAERRRARYVQWVEASRHWSGARPLQPLLPEGTVPYMFPLLLQAPQRQFPALKRRAVPLGRWDDMAVSDCPVATRYRSALVHLPCHQAIDDAQMDWLLNTVSTALQAG